MFAFASRGSPGTPPTAPSRIASCAAIAARSSSVSTSPVSRKRAAPSEKCVFSNATSPPATAASSTLRASATTSGPMPSPGMTASLTVRDMATPALDATTVCAQLTPRPQADVPPVSGWHDRRSASRTRRRPIAATSTAATMRPTPIHAATPTPLSKACARRVEQCAREVAGQLARRRRPHRPSVSPAAAAAARRSARPAGRRPNGRTR